MADEFDWETAKGIDEGLQYVGSDFDNFFGDGELEGRVWTSQSVISFYEDQQPTPKELNVICKNLVITLELTITIYLIIILFIKMMMMK